MITTNGSGGNRAAPLDVLGVGFGPSNLALAICLREDAPTSTCLFLERNAQFEWHPGMLIDGARMLRPRAQVRNGYGLRANVSSLSALVELIKTQSISCFSVLGAVLVLI